MMRLRKSIRSNSRGIVASAILFSVLLSVACGKSDEEKVKFLNSLLEPTPYLTKPPSPTADNNESRLYYGLARRPNYYEFIWIMGKSDIQEKSDDQVFYYWNVKGLHPSDPTNVDLVMAVFDESYRLTTLIFSDGTNTLHGDAKKMMGKGD